MRESNALLRRGDPSTLTGPDGLAAPLAGRALAAFAPDARTARADATRCYTRPLLREDTTRAEVFMVSAASSPRALSCGSLALILSLPTYERVTPEPKLNPNPLAKLS